MITKLLINKQNPKPIDKQNSYKINQYNFIENVGDITSFNYFDKTKYGRYIGIGTGHIFDIGDNNWDPIIPNVNDVTYIEELDEYRLYNGSEWVYFDKNLI